MFETSKPKKRGYGSFEGLVNILNLLTIITFHIAITLYFSVIRGIFTPWEQVTRKYS